MAYLGREAGTGIAATAQRQTFVGDGSTNFTLSRSIADSNPNFLEVFVSNVQQEPVLTYSVSGTTLTFTTAPDVGEPIYVIYRDYKAFEFGTVPDGSVSQAKMQSDSVGGLQLINNSVTGAKLADGNVTIAKMADGTFPVNAANIGINAITHVKVAADAIGTPQIKDGEVTTAKLAPGVIPVINAANIENNAVETAKIADDAVTSPKIAPIINLQEDILTTASAAIANVSINVLENSIRYFTSNNDKDFCINIRGDDSTTLNSMMETGNTITTALIVTNGSTAYFASNTQVDNVAVVPKVQGGSALTEGNASSTDIYTITVLKTGDAAFTMFLSQTQYA